MQSDFDDEKAKMNAQINELSVQLERAKDKIDDKDRTISELSSPVKV